MRTKTDLVDVGILTKLELFQKAAMHRSLELEEGTSEAYSKPIRVYILEKRLLAILKEQGIKQQDRPDCQNEILTLVDKNPQEKIPGYTSSNYWNFKLLEGDEHRFDLCVSLSISFSIEKRGVVFWPQAHGPFLSAADRLPNFRMFKALVESDDEASAIAKELVASDGNIVVTWTDLGLDGIRRLSDLFDEFAGGNDEIMRLGRNQEVLNPVPYPRHQQPGDRLFVTEPAQSKIIQAWQEQLKKYSACLIM